LSISLWVYTELIIYYLCPVWLSVFQKCPTCGAVNDAQTMVQQLLNAITLEGEITSVDRRPDAGLQTGRGCKTVLKKHVRAQGITLNAVCQCR